MQAPSFICPENEECPELDKAQAGRKAHRPARQLLPRCNYSSVLSRQNGILVSLGSIILPLQRLKIGQVIASTTVHWLDVVDFPSCALVGCVAVL
jgi:hypothetical protein